MHRTLTKAEARSLLNATFKAGALRDHVIFLLALHTGLREHEILALNMHDIFDSRHHAKRWVQLHTYKRSNHDPKSQQVALSTQCREKLDRLYTAKKRSNHYLADHAPVFISRQGLRLSDRRLRQIFVEWQKLAGFQRHFTFHALRHSACTNLYRQTKDIKLVQRFARHANIASTSIYTHTSDDELLVAVDNL